MNPLFFLAWKFLGRRRQESFIWFTSVASVLGIALGVASLMVVLGVMNGFAHDLKKKIIGANPHIVVEGDPYLSDYEEIGRMLREKIPEITSVSFFAQTQVIYKSSQYMVGGYIRGLVPQQQSAETAKFMKEGAFDALGNGTVIIGSELAKELEVKVGDTIMLIGGLPPREYPAKVVGLIEYGVYNIDVSIGIIPLDDFQNEFFHGRKLAHVGLEVKDIYSSERIASKISTYLPNFYRVTTWIRKNKILFSALALEKKAMLLILAIIILVASFNIASGLMMTVYRKIREIGVLRTLGLTAWDIRRVFVFQALILGIEGLVLGLITGGVLIIVLKKYLLIRLPEFVYNISYLPVEISWREIILIVVAVLVMTFAASILPAYRAGKLEPATAIRYE